MIPRGFFRVGGQTVGFDALYGQPGYILKRNMQDGMLGHRGMAVSDYPLLMELSRLFLVEALGDLTE